MSATPARILFTTVCRPFGGPGEGDSVGAELFHAQMTRAQGVFSLRQVVRCWALDYLAENIQVPSVALHYPLERELVAELRRNRFEYVGINFVVATFHKVRAMAKLIRKHAPQARIILGGYGTVLPDELLQPFADEICREEGVTFMRRLLGESIDVPIEHPYAPTPSMRIYSYQQPTLVGHLTSGLGCPNGCDFCCTSHFFKRRYVPLAKTGKDIFDALCAMEEQASDRGEELGAFTLIDEDFFLHKRRAREFLACQRKYGKNWSLMGFGSVKSLSQFTPEEIAEMGFDLVWTAFEGAESGYNKLDGRSLPELYAGLQAHGVNILTSMIIGFPYQDRRRLFEDFEQLIALRPAMTQILIYFAFPGTPFYDQVIREGRYLPEYAHNPDLRKWDGFALHFKHPSFTPAQLEALHRELYRREFELLGPSIVRLTRGWFNGYKNLRDSSSPLLRQRAARKWRDIREGLPGIVPAMLGGPTAATRKEAWALYRDIRAEMHGMTLGERLRCTAVPAVAGFTWLTDRAGLFQQPALLRVEHPTTRTSAPNAMRLQGGFQNAPLARLAEDLLRNGRLVARRWMPTNAARRSNGDGYPTDIMTNPRDTAVTELTRIRKSDRSATASMLNAAGPDDRDTGARAAP